MGITLPARPDANDLCERAAWLESIGRTDDAKAAYLAALAIAPDHLATLGNLGALLHRTSYRSAARTVFAQAVACHPNDAASRVNLANILREAGELAAARTHLQAALLCAPDFPQAHQALGDVLAEQGDHMGSMLHWERGYRGHAIHAWRFRGQTTPVRVLMLISVANGNLAARVFLDDRIFAVTTIAMEFYTADLPLPAHDLVLNAIGDADLCAPALSAAVALIARTDARVVNHPTNVLATRRANAACILHGVENVVIARVATVAKHDITGADGAARLAGLGLDCPMLLRAPGFHAGRHFERVDHPSQLASVASALPGDRLLAMEYLDSRGSDGRARKGRVMTIGGRLHPLHWAISSQWKVHYFTAGMADHQSHRDEEAAFLSDMASFLGATAMAALATVADRLGLDYGGIDFALTPDRRVMLFEANATMAIVPPPEGALWDYRRPASRRAVLATQQMLRRPG